MVSKLIQYFPPTFFLQIFSDLKRFLVIVLDGCVNYKVLDELNRSAGYTGALADCDQTALISPAWYRFNGSAGDKMADSCVRVRHCGTHAPGWLDGNHPINVGEVVERQVCFHWGSNCCKWSVKIKVKKCSGFFAYELQRTPTCHLRYCGNAGLGKKTSQTYKYDKATLI